MSVEGRLAERGLILPSPCTGREVGAHACSAASVAEPPLDIAE